MVHPSSQFSTTLILETVLLHPKAQAQAQAQALEQLAAHNAHANPFLTPLSLFLTGITLLALLTILPQAPVTFSKMPSDPKATSSSSSSRDREKSSSSSSSSSSRDKPSSSSSSSSAPAPSNPGMPQGPYISANAWMSFFLFCCLVLIILQGPLGLSSIGAGAGAGVSTFGGFGNLGWGGGLGGGVGCQGLAAGYVPWCAAPAAVAAVPAVAAQPVGYGVGVPAVAAQPPAVIHQHHHHQPAPVVVRQPPRYAGYGAQAQGSIVVPGGGGQWSWSLPYGRQQLPPQRQCPLVVLLGTA